LTTVLEKLKTLDAQRAQLLEGAKKEALDNAEKAVAELNELGFDYRLVEGAPTAARAPSKAASQAHPAQYANSKRHPIMMGECTGHKSPKSHSTSRNSWKRG
jgi:hypothetical protein